MKPNKPYTIIDTAGQKTAVVINNFTRPQQPLVAKLLMAQQPLIEQVAFLEKPNGFYRVQMMGNELSINGSLAGAYIIGQLTQTSLSTLEISGLNQPVTTQKANGNINLNLPKKIIESIRNNIVLLQGITYKVMPGFPPTRLITPAQKRLLKSLARTAPAAGIVFYQGNQILPLVYVKATNSFVWENACGSGSLAFFLVTRINPVIQPSGQTIKINQKSDTLTMTAPVKEIIND